MPWEFISLSNSIFALHICSKHFFYTFEIIISIFIDYILFALFSILPQSTFTIDTLISMLRCISSFSRFMHLDWLFCAEFKSDISFSLRFVNKKASGIPQPTFQTFSKILNFRHQLAAVKPIIDAFWNKWYQQTQKIILYHIEQEKLQVIHISEKNFKYTKNPLPGRQWMWIGSAVPPKFHDDLQVGLYFINI